MNLLSTSFVSTHFNYFVTKNARFFLYIFRVFFLMQLQTDLVRFSLRFVFAHIETDLFCFLLITFVQCNRTDKPKTKLKYKKNWRKSAFKTYEESVRSRLHQLEHSITTKCTSTILIKSTPNRKIQEPKQ